MLHKLKEMKKITSFLKIPGTNSRDQVWQPLCLDSLLLVLMVSEPRQTTNGLSLEVEDIGNGAASQADECKKRTGPFVAQTLVHLLCEEHGGGTPDGTDEGLGCESGCGLVLVGVNWRDS